MMVGQGAEERAEDPEVVKAAVERVERAAVVRAAVEREVAERAGWKEAQVGARLEASPEATDWEGRAKGCRRVIVNQ